MTHYKMSDSVPSVMVLSKNPQTSSIDEIKLYDNKNYYLNDKQEFQLRFFNPLTETIGAQITINGKTTGSYLVLKPGEDVIIDRFLDDKRKMLFETYEYDASNVAAKNAVALNGIINVKFYKEYANYYNSTTITLNTPYYQPYYWGTTTTGNNMIYGSSNIGTFTNSCSTMNLFASDSNISEPISKGLKETGRVEKGDVSNQTFKTVSYNFNSFPFHTVEYNLKPISEHTETEIREYCTSCGYRLRKKSWKFCPKCGEKC